MTSRFHSRTRTLLAKGSFSLVGLLFSLAVGCSPKPEPKTAVDIQTERLVTAERKAAVKADMTEAEAVALGQHYADLWAHCSVRGVWDDQARAECKAVWNR